MIQLTILLILLLAGPASPLATPQAERVKQDQCNKLSGNWAEAKQALRRPDCCVINIEGLQSQLQVLQTSLADNGPMDIDLRTRVRGSHLEEDCLKLQKSILGDASDDSSVTAALAEIASGAASLADGPLEEVCEDVFLRIVCASDYKARDPMFHTDKCPIRGYVTLRGVGTEFRTTPCNPVEYAALRGLGRTEANNQNIRQAQLLEFIVMKGDHYKATAHAASSWWSRESTCVHRSPPGSGGRRVILSFDLAAGEDDREWYEADKRREWRSGMTQRKSKLVA